MPVGGWRGLGWRGGCPSDWSDLCSPADTPLADGEGGVDRAMFADESKVSRNRRKTLQQSSADCKRVSPMPAGSECHTSGFRSWERRGNRIVVKMVIVSVGGVAALKVVRLVLAGGMGDGELLRAEERRTRWRELRAWERI